MIDTTLSTILIGLNIGVTLTLGLLVILWASLQVLLACIVVAQHIKHRWQHRRPAPLMSTQHPFIIHGDEVANAPAFEPVPEPVAPPPQPVAKVRKPRVVK